VFERVDPGSLCVDDYYGKEDDPEVYIETGVTIDTVCDTSFVEERSCTVQREGDVLVVGSYLRWRELDAAPCLTGPGPVMATIRCAVEPGELGLEMIYADTSTRWYELPSCTACVGRECG
jgi:hypothetical protein